MKTKITFLAAFTIPKQLPNQQSRHDHITVIDGDAELWLHSEFGNTTFPKGSWSESPKEYTIAANTIADYDGTHNALNAIVGIEFPECKIGPKVKSTYGNFKTWEEYQAARLFHEMCKEVLLHKFFRHNPSDRRTGEEILQEAKVAANGIKAMFEYGKHICEADGNLPHSPLMSSLEELRLAAGYKSKNGPLNSWHDAAITSVIFNRKVEIH